MDLQSKLSELQARVSDSLSIINQPITQNGSAGKVLQQLVIPLGTAPFSPPI